MPNPKYIPRVGNEYQRIPELKLTYDEPNTAKGTIVEVTAVLKADGKPAELANRPRLTVPFTLGPEDFSRALPIVNPDTDEAGLNAYPPEVLNAWAGAIQAGQMPVSLMQVGVFSGCRHFQNLRDNPPPPPDPVDPEPGDPEAP